MTFKPLATALAFTLATLAGSAQAAPEGRAFEATTLNLSASGEVKAAPDQATITLGVRTTARTAAEAMAANRDRMATTIAALKAQQVSPKDIRTVTVNLAAQYAYDQNQPPRLTGYQADNEVSVTVRDIARLGATIDAVTAGGANQVNGIGFGLADPAPTLDEARRQAVKTLRLRADLYAQAAGLRVLRLVNLSEGGGYQPGPPRGVQMMAMARSSEPTPVEPGELNVQVQLNAVYELGN